MQNNIIVLKYFMLKKAYSWIYSNNSTIYFGC